MPVASASNRAMQVLNRLVDQQAFMLSANDIFYVSALLFLGLIGIIWLARPVRSRGRRCRGGRRLNGDER